MPVKSTSVTVETTSQIANVYNAIPQQFAAPANCNTLNLAVLADPPDNSSYPSCTVLNEPTLSNLMVTDMQGNSDVATVVIGPIASTTVTAFWIQVLPPIGSPPGTYLPTPLQLGFTLTFNPDTILQKILRWLLRL